MLLHRRHLFVVLLLCSVIADRSPAQAPAAGPAWPFNRVPVAAAPSVEQPGWVRNDIDRFVLARLEAEGLAPAGPAGRGVLLRRLYFDLVGLPPTPTELQAFLGDQDVRAYEKVVDRLLGDPRYGERWARFWLDLARYADTAGYEGDPDLPHAWRYRDYVIDSLNRDKPYDLFIKEQLAGDEFAAVLGAGELPEPSAERVVAVTFLRLAPFTEPRGDETRHELLSEMTATVGEVFLGLTVGCAKCHDHKHDPIPTRDFYRMKAFFATIAIPPPKRGDGFQIGGPLPAAFSRKGEAEWATRRRRELAAELESSKKELAVLTRQLGAGLQAPAGLALQSLGGDLGNNYFFDTAPVADGHRHVAIVASDGRRWTFSTDGVAARKLGQLSGSNKGDWFGDIPRPGHIGLGDYTAGTGQPQSAAHQGAFGDVLIYDHVLSGSEQSRLLAYLDGKYEQPANSPKSPPADGLRFWLDASDIDADPDTPQPGAGTSVSRWVDRISGVSLEQATAALAPRLATLGSRKTPAVLFANDFLRASTAKARFLEDQQGTIVVVFSATHQGEGYGLEVGGEGVFLATAIYPNARKSGSLEAAINDPEYPGISDEDRRQYRFLATRPQSIAADIKRLQPLAMSLRHSFGPPYEPGVPTSRVMIRGEYDNPGEVVVPGFPKCVTGHQEPAPIRLDPFKRWPTRSRRMALAEWIASKQNPLTARVMVNRLWHWHFGRGIVATPSDFGSMGGKPSHPALLDWLAGRFMKENWSLKAMHRLMVTSATFRQDSRNVSPIAAQQDSENTLLWRFRRRRLEAEAVRDCVLLVSGRLNPEHYGLPIFPALPGDISEVIKWKTSKWHTHHDARSRKRSIYIYQQRSLSMPFMQAFDALVCDQSRPRRRTSVTPLQALAMYNGDFVNEESRHFAARLRRETTKATPQELTRRAFLLAYSREPAPEETRRLAEFLESSAAGVDPLTSLCRILLNSNEFITID